MHVTYFLDGEHHNGGNDRDTDTGQDSKGGASDELVGVLEGLLKSGDGEKSQVLLLLSIANQVHIHQLLDLSTETNIQHKG